MDKWKLLRSALQGKRESDSAASIHRNDGIFSLIEKNFTAWEWTLDLDVDADTSLETLQQECHTYMMVRDIIELSLRLSTSVAGSTHLQGLIESAVAKECCRLKEGESVGDGATTAEVYWRDNSVSPFMPNAKFYKWTLSSGEVLHAREKAKDAGIGINQLLSHKLHGVDNTGNVKVWAAESMLLHVLLNNYRNEFENRSILELGGGLTALCGLGMAAAIPSCSLVATDGHPDCVANQNVCIHMSNQQRRSEDLPPLAITSCLLRWSKDDEHQELAGILESNKQKISTHKTDEGNEEGDKGKFTRIIAADCLFFRDFHVDLVWLLKAALAPAGVIFLLQPRRGGTMDEFIAKAESVFSIAIVTDYDTDITVLHHQYMRESGGGDKAAIYDPDIHYPVLLMLTHRAEASTPFLAGTSGNGS